MHSTSQTMSRERGSPVKKRLHEPALLETHQEKDPFLRTVVPSAEIKVGSSLFIVRSRDDRLIRELSLFRETLKKHPFAETRFTHKLLCCIAEGRLQPWGGIGSRWPKIGTGHLFRCPSSWLPCRVCLEGLSGLSMGKIVTAEVT